MQDKIQEIMGLVELHAQMHRASFMGSAKEYSAFRSEADKTKNKIQSKLRELVREPLSDEHVLSMQERYVGGVCPQYPLDVSDWINFARAIERAHGITNTSGE